MKLKYQFSETNVGSEIYMVPVGCIGEFNGLLTVNETMKDVLDLLKEDRTEEALCIEMMKRYKDVTAEEISEKIHEICLSLEKDGFLIV